MKKRQQLRAICEAYKVLSHELGSSRLNLASVLGKFHFPRPDPCIRCLDDEMCCRAYQQGYNANNHFHDARTFGCVNQCPKKGNCFTVKEVSVCATIYW